MVTGIVLIGLGLLGILVLAAVLYRLRNQDPFFTVMALLWGGLLILACFADGIQKLERWEEAKVHHGR